MHANAYILLFLLLTVSYKFQLLFSRTHTNHCCCSCFYCCNFGIVVMMICVLLNATSCHISFDNALSSVLLSCLLHGLSLISAHMGASFCFALLGDQIALQVYGFHVLMVVCVCNCIQFATVPFLKAQSYLPSNLIDLAHQLKLVFKRHSRKNFAILI